MPCLRVIQPLFPLLSVGLVLTGAVTGAEPEPFEAFLKTHCLSCHGPEKEKGNLRIDALSRDFKSGLDTHLWHEVIERINSGEMPPEEEPRPTQEEIAAFIPRLDVLMKEGK